MDQFIRFTIAVLTIGAWASAVILVRAAWEIHVGALLERAIVAVVIALAGTLYSIVLFNGNLTVLDHTSITALVRIAIGMILIVPLFWTWLYLTGRLR